MLKPAELYTHTHTHTHTHTQLRRCLAVLLFAFFPYNSFSTTACTEDGTRAVVLDPDVRVVSRTPQNSSGEHKWTGTLSDGRIIRGISACLTGDFGVVQGDPYTDNNSVLIDNDKVVVGGEKNGGWCWCKLVYPVVSFWISFYDIDKLEGQGRCARVCGDYCGYKFYENSSNWHKKMFSAVQH